MCKHNVITSPSFLRLLAAVCAAVALAGLLVTAIMLFNRHAVPVDPQNPLPSDRGGRYALPGSPFFWLATPPLLLALLFWLARPARLLVASLLSAGLFAFLIWFWATSYIGLESYDLAYASCRVGQHWDVYHLRITSSHGVVMLTLLSDQALKRVGTGTPGDRELRLAHQSLHTRQPLLYRTRPNPPEVVRATPDWIVDTTGFQLAQCHFWHFNNVLDDIDILVPHWFLLLFCVPVPLLYLRRLLRQRSRRKHGLCLTCGYDLRAHTPNTTTTTNTTDTTTDAPSPRCPECGTPIPASTASKSTAAS